MAVSDSDGLTVMGATTADGNVSLAAGGDLSVTGVNANCDVELGSSGALSGAVTGNMLKARAVAGIDLNTAVVSADATVSGTGDLSISDSDALNVTNATTSDGKITLNAGGDLSVVGVDANGDVDLTSGGVLSGTITGSNLKARAVDGVDLNTTVVAANAAVSGSGDLIVSDSDALTVTNATTANGKVTLNAGGNLLVSGVDANGDVDLSSSGALSGTLAGNNLKARAVDGIDLNTTVTNADVAVSGTGDLSVTDSDALTVRTPPRLTARSR